MEQLSGQSSAQSRDNLNEENDLNKKIEKQETELNELKTNLALVKEESIRLRVNCDSMKKQAEAVSEEYDRLLVEHDKLQVCPTLVSNHSLTNFYLFPPF